MKVSKILYKWPYVGVFVLIFLVGFSIHALTIKEEDYWSSLYFTYPRLLNTNFSEEIPVYFTVECHEKEKTHYEYSIIIGRTKVEEGSFSLTPGEKKNIEKIIRMDNDIKKSKKVLVMVRVENKDVLTIYFWVN